MQVLTYNNLERGEDIFRYQVDGNYESKVEMGSAVAPHKLLLQGEGRQIVSRLDLSLLFGVPAHKIKKYLKVDDGMFVKKGDIVASSKGWTIHRVIAPIDGVIQIDPPNIIFYTPYQSAEVRSGVWGNIRYIDRGGMSIHSDTIRIKGTLGSGKTIIGPLILLNKTDSLVDVAKVSSKVLGSIVYVPYSLTEGAYLKLAAQNAKGIISPAIQWTHYRKLYTIFKQNWPIPFVITQGWGSMATYKHLQHLWRWSAGRDLKLMGNEQTIALSWNANIHRSAIDSFHINRYQQINSSCFADLHIHDRIRLADAREGLVDQIIDDEYASIKVGGAQWIVNKEEICRMLPTV